MPDTRWGWFNTAPTSDGNVHWIRGTLEDTYHRVSYHGGQWILVSANPIDEYYRILAEVASNA